MHSHQTKTGSTKAGRTLKRNGTTAERRGSHGRRGRGRPLRTLSRTSAELRISCGLHILHSAFAKESIVLLDIMSDSELSSDEEVLLICLGLKHEEEQKEEKKL